VALPLVPSLELQLAKVSLLAMAYSVTFACLAAARSFDSQRHNPANAGAAAEVPPIA